VCLLWLVGFVSAGLDLTVVPTLRGRPLAAKSHDFLLPHLHEFAAAYCVPAPRGLRALVYWDIFPNPKTRPCRTFVLGLAGAIHVFPCWDVRICEMQCGTAHALLVDHVKLNSSRRTSVLLKERIAFRPQLAGCHVGVLIQIKDASPATVLLKLA